MLIGAQHRRKREAAQTQAADAEPFAQWAARNLRIEHEDILQATKEQNPTTTFLVIEIEGVPVLSMPVYLAMRIGYLNFNPEAGREERELAMESMLGAVKVFARGYHIHRIETLTRSGIPVAEWARAHGFTPEKRELFTLKIDSPEKADAAAQTAG